MSKLTRGELVENAWDCIASELSHLPDDRARCAVFIRMAAEAREWEDVAVELADLPSSVEGESK